MERMIPYNRPFPSMIIQDPDLLLSITEFDYVFSDNDFLQYFRDRTGIQVYIDDETDILFFGEPNEHISDIVQKLSDNETMLDGGFRIVEPNDCRHLNIVKAKIQDCWEVWKNIEM